MKKLTVLVIIMCTFFLPTHAINLPDGEYIQREVQKMIDDPKYAATVDFCLWYAQQEYKRHEVPPDWINDAGYISMFKVAMEVETKRAEWEALQEEKE